jgi:serine/threonine protein phosphatase PrpC
MIKLTLDACVAQHKGDRPEQQDRAALLRNPRQKGVVLAVVADGMGGHAGSVLAAEQVVLTAKQNMETFAPAHEAPESLLQSTIDEAHQMIRTHRAINERQPHSTVVMLLVQSTADGWQATWAHSGDSRLYRIWNDRVIAQTGDHSLVEEMLRQGKITQAEADRHPQKNVLLTSLGGPEIPHVDFSSASGLTAGDSFLLCSDGVWTYFGNQELGTIIGENSARQAAEMLLKRARQRARGAGDNLSLAVVKLVANPKPG